jgi:hypothetical protein
VYAPNASVVISCGKSLTFTEWAATGLDVGTTLADLPPSSTIIGWAAELLGIPQ